MRNVNNQKKNIEIQTQYGSHLCVFERDENKGFIVTAKYLRGVISWGKNLKHAKEMAKEVIELCIECLAEERIRKQSETSHKISAGVEKVAV